jgi:ribonuclease BN (tRNA processing enzyme)
VPTSIALNSHEEAAHAVSHDHHDRIHAGPADGPSRIAAARAGGASGRGDSVRRTRHGQRPEQRGARAQPANALVVGGQVYLVDAGDGAVAQLAKAGLRLGAVRGVFLSHLHFDHTGGMLAVLGLRMQLEVRGRLRIFGPPGTKTLVDGLLAASAPAMRAGYGIPGQPWSTDVEVVELHGGDTIAVDAFKVTAAANSHFSRPEGDTSTPEGLSLSYRFDLADRSIVYTGDTGASPSVVALSRGADLLVSEMLDADAVLATMRPAGVPPAAPQTATGFEWHLRAHHMTPAQVGELAAAANAKRLVITHFAPNITSPEHEQRYRDAIRTRFSGDVTLARDLDRF